jgi:hypothetical protein
LGSLIKCVSNKKVEVSKDGKVSVIFSKGEEKWLDDVLTRLLKDSLTTGQLKALVERAAAKKKEAKEIGICKIK